MMRRNLLALLMIGMMWVPGAVAEEETTASTSEPESSDESSWLAELVNGEPPGPSPGETCLIENPADDHECLLKNVVCTEPTNDYGPRPIQLDGDRIQMGNYQPEQSPDNQFGPYSETWIEYNGCPMPPLPVTVVGLW